LAIIVFQKVTCVTSHHYITPYAQNALLQHKHERQTLAPGPTAHSITA